MGMLYVYLPDVKQLQNELNQIGLETFVKRYTSYESLSGSSESMKFVEEKVEEYKKLK